MRLTLDTAELRSSIPTWRDAVVLTRSRGDGPNDSDAFLIGKRLAVAAERVDGCLMLLDSCTVREHDATEFAALIRELREFRDWVQQGLDAVQIVRSLPTADVGPKTAAAPRRSPS
jgi:hypothetical protein